MPSSENVQRSPAVVRQDIENTINGARRWRSEKAFECPHDSRNRAAVEQLETIEWSMKDVPVDLLIAYEEVYQESLKHGDYFTISQLWSETLRRIGFESVYGSASELLKGFILEASRATKH